MIGLTLKKMTEGLMSSQSGGKAAASRPQCGLVLAFLPRNVLCMMIPHRITHMFGFILIYMCPDNFIGLNVTVNLSSIIFIIRIFSEVAVKFFVHV